MNPADRPRASILLSAALMATISVGLYLDSFALTGGPWYWGSGLTAGFGCAFLFHLDSPLNKKLGEK